MPRIIPKYSGLHNAADGKTKYRFVAGKEIDVKDGDLKSVDVRDYEVVKPGKAGKEGDK